MRIQGVKSVIPQVVGILRVFRGAISTQAQRQVENVKVEVKRLVNYKA
tara:strand:+ start:504 stop:647 length:144 start_codon:yes stop_codon:yes gene_type:complete